MDADSIVGVLVGILGVHALGQRRESIGQTAVFLHLSAFLGRQGTLALDVLKALVDVHITGSHVKQGTTCINLRFHARKHVVNRREFDNRLVELLTLVGVFQSLVVSLLSQTDGLCSNAQTGTIHQSHDILDKPQTGLTAKFGFGVFVGQFAGRGAVDAEFMLDVAHIDAALTLVVDEHRQAATVLGAFLGTGQHEVNVGVAVGDETLHAVEQIATILFGISGLQHDALQVGAGIRLGEVHRHGFAGTDARNVFHALLLVTKFIQGVDARLQGPDVLEASIGGGDHFAQHGENGDGQVQATVTARHGNAPEAALSAGIEVLNGLGGIDHATILQMRTFEVHALGVGFDDVGGDVARDV